jgi:integrase
MGEVNFYLKKPALIDKHGKKIKASNTKSLIVLYKRYKGKSLVVSTGQFIDEKNWNKNKQRVKSNTTTINDGSEFLNTFLDKLELKCTKAFNAELQKGIPAPETLKNELKKYINHVEESEADSESFFQLVDRFISGEIKTKGKDKSPGTLKNYTTAKLHLQAFQKYTKSKITFDKIDLSFFYSYVSFLKSKENLGQNSIAKNIKTLKVFMGEAVDLGLTNNMQFKHKKFAVQEDQTDAVYLTDKEISKIYRLDLSENKKLERAKDLFVFGCYVGLRFSDYSTIKPENIVNIEEEQFIKIVTTKTKELVIIPCNPTVLQIFEKYKDSHNSLPRSYSNQKFNEYIKEVCEKAELNETGRLATDLEKKLYECVSSHTARRSFCTNLYLDGFPTIEIMKISGHKTETSFLKYIKVSKLDSAKRLSAFIKKGWSEKMMKVA